MKFLFYISICLVIVISCNKNPDTRIENNEVGTVVHEGIADSSADVAKNKKLLDEGAPVVFTLDTIVLNSIEFITYSEDESVKQITTLNSDTIIGWKPGIRNIEFLDFNNDNYTDLKVNYFANVPGVVDIYLFNRETYEFIKLEKFNYCHPQNLEKTKYYFSQGKTGCAGYNWESELFIISNFSAQTIAYVYVNNCPDDKEKGIYTYFVKNGMKIPKDTLPVSYLDKFENSELTYAEEFWKENYK